LSHLLLFYSMLAVWFINDVYLVSLASSVNVLISSALDRVVRAPIRSNYRL